MQRLGVWGAPLTRNRRNDNVHNVAWLRIIVLIHFSLNTDFDHLVITIVLCFRLGILTLAIALTFHLLVSVAVTPTLAVALSLVERRVGRHEVERHLAETLRRRGKTHNLERLGQGWEGVSIQVVREVCKVLVLDTVCLPLTSLGGGSTNSARRLIWIASSTSSFSIRPACAPVLAA